MPVYSASKHLQPPGEAPSSVTVVTGTQIREQGYRTLADVLRTVRGFFVTYDRNYSSLGVRGFSRPGDYNTRILLLIDGHRLNDNIYDDAMIGTEFPVDLDLIKQIEIVRGPVSSLYGSNALFAVITIVTKHAQDLGGLELSAEALSYNTYKGSISYGRRESDHRGREYRDDFRQDQGNHDLSPYSLFLDDRRKSFIGALYVQDELAIASNLTVNAGVRYDYYSSVSASTDPRIAVIYHPTRNNIFKLVYGQSFRVPNVYEKYYAVCRTFPIRT